MKLSTKNEVTITLTGDEAAAVARWMQLNRAMNGDTPVASLLGCLERRLNQMHKAAA